MNQHDCNDPDCGKACHICHVGAHATAQHNAATRDLQHGVQLTLYLHEDGFVHCPSLEELSAFLYEQDTVLHPEAMLKSGDPIEIRDHVALSWSPSHQTWILDRLP